MKNKVYESIKGAQGQMVSKHWIKLFLWGWTWSKEKINIRATKRLVEPKTWKRPFADQHLVVAELQALKRLYFHSIPNNKHQQPVEFYQTHPHLLKQVERERERRGKARGGGRRGQEGERERGGGEGGKERGERGVSDMCMFLQASSFYEDVNEQRV